MKRVVIQWPRLGPYHLARLGATHRLMQAEGVELTALETAPRDAIYAWDEEAADHAFRREQVFPGQTYDSVPPREMYRQVTRALDRLQPDAVAIHTYSLPDSWACLAWCRKHHRGAVVMTDSKADDADRSGLREEIKRTLLKGFDAALTAGSASRQYLLDLGFDPARITTGYDVVDNAFFARQAAAAPAPEGLERPYFLASNRFIARKNLPRLLSAYASYRDRVEAPWGLVMLGDGPLRADLEAAAGPGVVFTGFRQIDEIPGFYGHAAAFVHPAEVDQWALVINEAMAAGLPVVASTGAGATHDLVVEGKNGFSFDPAVESQLAEALVKMHHADRPAMGEASRRIISDWDLDRFAASVLEACRVAAAGAHRPNPLALRIMLATMRFTARSTSTFHSVEW